MEIRQTGRNERFLPGIEVPRRWVLQGTCLGPSQELSALWWLSPRNPSGRLTRCLGDFSGLVTSVTKGIEYENRPHDVRHPRRRMRPTPDASLCPARTFAIEVARDIPTAIVAASRDSPQRRKCRSLFSRPAFRVYTSTDLLRGRAWGALKNVIAIAGRHGRWVGLCDNSKAALVTRAIVEMRRLGVACGAQGETFTA